MSTHITALQRKAENVKENKAYRNKRKKEEVVKILIKELNKISTRSKTDLSCIRRCCQLIENLVKKKYKLDKFMILVEALTGVFGVLAAPEIEQIRKMVQDIIDDKLVAKIPMYKEFVSYAKKVFQHNFLFRGE